MASRAGIKLSKALARIDALTVRRIAEGKYKPKKRALHDGGGLFLRTPESGGGSWVFRFQSGGRVHMMGLGSVAQVGAPEARDMAAQYRKLLAAGQHPLHERRQERRQQQAEVRAAGTTFREVAELVLADIEASPRSAITRRSWRQVLETYAYPALGSKPAGEIERHHVLDVLRPLWGTMRDTSRRLRRRIEAVLDRAIDEKVASGPNPARASDLKRSLAAYVVAPRGNHKALPWRQVPGLMQKLLANDSLSAKALRLAILSGCRTSEVIGARFDEFAHGIWTVPAERMKGEVGKRRPHRVPITSGIQSVVDALKPKPGQKISPLLFANPSTGEPLSNMAMLQLIKGMGYECTTHGMRSALRDFAGDNGFAREVAEAALAHVVPGVEGSYARSDLLARRRELMQAWSDHCLGVAKPAKVARRRK
jgi:integrase